MNKKYMSFEDIFTLYAKNTDGEGKMIDLAQSDKWMKQAGLLKENYFSTSDTAAAFEKMQHAVLSKEEYEQFVTELCKEKNIDVKEVKKTMTDAFPRNRRKTLVPRIGAAAFRTKNISTNDLENV